MLGLPSTTEVGRRLPKEAFYRNLKLSPGVRESFVRDVEAVTVANSVKATTANIADGERVHEILVMRVDLRGTEVPAAVIEAIDGANSAKKLFACVNSGEACLAVRVGKLVVGPWLPADQLRLEVGSGSLDTLWDSLASQVVYDDTGKGDESVEERFAREEKIRTMREEIEKLDKRCRKEKQVARKNQLFDKMRKLQAELRAFEEGR